MTWSDAAVEIAKYLAASGFVGVAGVVFTTWSSQRHELRKDVLVEERLRNRDWREFQRTSLIELQDIMWELLEQVHAIARERDLVRMGVKHALSVQDALLTSQRQLRRVEVLAARIEDDAIRESAERLRSYAYQAFQLVGESAKAQEMQGHLNRFTQEYNDCFRTEVRRVLKDIIARSSSAAITK